MDCRKTLFYWQKRTKMVYYNANNNKNIYVLCIYTLYENIIVMTFSNKLHIAFKFVL